MRSHHPLELTVPLNRTWWISEGLHDVVAPIPLQLTGHKVRLIFGKFGMKSVPPCFHLVMWLVAMSSAVIGGHVRRISSIGT